MQARAYAEVQGTAACVQVCVCSHLRHCSTPDPTLSVAIGGDVGEARASQRSTQAEQSGGGCVTLLGVSYPGVCIH